MASSDAVAALRAQERGVLIQIASMIMEKAISLSSWSKHISSSFHLSEVTELSDGMMITIGNSAPEALAFERGSGIHGPTGETYDIVPKNANALAFLGTHGYGNPWVITQHVSHPGVGARPYMHPANEAVRPVAMEMLKQAVGSAVRLTIQEAWKRE